MFDKSLDTEKSSVKGIQHFHLVFILCALGANPVKTFRSDIKDRFPWLALPLSSVNHHSYNS